MKQSIEIELTNIVLLQINKYLKKNEQRIDGSGMEIFCAILNVLTILMAESDYEPETMIEFIQQKFPEGVREHRRLSKNADN